MGAELRSGYDRVAEDYAGQFRDELDKKPFDRKMLDWLAEKVGGSGVNCDIGCGPGQVARYLHGRGVEARRRSLSGDGARGAEAEPGIDFQQGDMLALSEVEADAYGGIAAFYSIAHIPRRKLPQTLREFGRVLRPRGVLLLAFHIGREVNHLDEWLGKEVSLDFLFYETEELRGRLTAAGFALEEVIERDPYPEAVEYQSRRAYILARKG